MNRGRNILEAVEYLTRIVSVVLAEERVGIVLCEAEKHVLDNNRVNQRADAHYKRAADNRKRRADNYSEGFLLPPCGDRAFEIFLRNTVAADFILQDQKDTRAKARERDTADIARDRKREDRVLCLVDVAELKPEEAARFLVMSHAKIHDKIGKSRA